MSDAEQCEPPAKKSRVDAAEEAFRKAQQDLVRSASENPNSSLVPVLQQVVDRAWETLQYDENRQSSTRHALLNKVAKVGSA